MSDTSTRPWYLQSSYSENDLAVDADGNVQAATVPALVERLTTHETNDPGFVKTFLLTYKSFTTLDELLDLLVQRFYIQQPDSLTASAIELEEWKQLKQHVVQSRVLDTLEAVLIGGDGVERDDMYILGRVKEFLQQEVVSTFATSQRLLVWINRVQSGGLTGGSRVAPNPVSPPAPIVPVTTRTPTFLDIHPLELARQLTLVESQLYQQIRPADCLARLRNGNIHPGDSIARIIQVTNKVANWVADTVLTQDDSKIRAAFLKRFILVADSCRTLHNYSSMVAIISGLNSPPIRRLKRSWKHVNSRHLSQLGACETTIDTGNRFINYRSTLAKVSPPCVPFVGVFLTNLTPIQDGSKDTVPGNLVNFRKRQKASEVIQDIQRWQTLPHHFHPLSAVQMYIEESLGKFNDQVDVGDMFWNRSLVREPSEREDDMMARLLKESGFL